MSAVLTSPLYREPVEFRAVVAPVSRIDVVREWCASMGISPTKGDVAALLVYLFPSMTVAELLGEKAS